MSVVNTTYNFNQPNMNFGQALLYGAFGSLTGGMGCFGGGYGMGMGGFGFGGSIFPMGTMMTGYNCMAGMGCYSDQMAGAQVGNILSGVVVGVLSQKLQGKGGNDNETTASKIKTIETNASEHLEVLNKGGKKYSLENNDFKSASINDEPEYEKAVQSAQENIDDANLSINKLESEIKSLKESPQYSKPVKQEGDNDYNKKVKDWEAFVEKVTEKEQELKQLKEKITENGKYGKALKKAQDEKAAREKEISDAIKALTPLKKEYDELRAAEKQEREEIKDEADGNWLNRASKSSIEKYTGKDENGNPVEATKSQIRGAFNQFIKAQKAGKTEDEKRYGQILANMHKNSPTNFKDFEDAYKTLNLSKYEE